MAGIDQDVSLSPEQASKAIYSAVVDGSFTGTLIDRYSVQGGENTVCLIEVYEKHYYRAGNRLTLTVTIDNMSGHTHIHSIGGGGGEGLFRFDWGAAESFEGIIADALSPYKT